MRKHPVLLDVDAGVDDTLAIFFAMLSPRIDVKAITTVAGNVPVRFCSRNVLLSLEILSPVVARVPPVAQGASKPLRRTLFSAAEVHGEDGIGGASRFYARPTMALRDGGAVDLISEMLARYDNLTIIATGPLTNLAVAVKRNPAVMRRVREIVIMGGGFNGARNTGPASEFNFYVDPEAADLVLNSGLPIRLVPLNVTEQCRFTPADLAALPDSPMKVFLRRATRLYFQFHMKTRNFLGGYLHDPLAVGAVIEPSILSTRRGYVVVEHVGRYTRGVSIFFPRFDSRKEAALPSWQRRMLRDKPRVQVAAEVNVKRFKELFLSTIALSDE